MAKLISKTYGEALYELAVEENNVDEYFEEVQMLKKVLNENKDFIKLMEHPQIVKEEKIKVMETVLNGRVSKELVGFFDLIITKGRYSEIHNILEYFVSRVKELNKIGVCYVTAAIDLDDSQKMQVEEKMLQTTRYEKMEMHYDQDKGLIGGMVIQIGDRVVDSSIRTKLNKLQKQLLKIQLG